MILNRSIEWSPLSYPKLNEETPCLSPVCTMLAVAFCRCYIKLRKVPCILSLLRIFIMSGCWILSMFFCIY